MELADRFLFLWYFKFEYYSTRFGGSCFSFSQGRSFNARGRTQSASARLGCGLLPPFFDTFIYGGSTILYVDRQFKIA